MGDSTGDLIKNCLVRKALIAAYGPEQSPQASPEASRLRLPSHTAPAMSCCATPFYRRGDSRVRLAVLRCPLLRNLLLLLCFSLAHLARWKAAIFLRAAVDIVRFGFGATTLSLDEARLAQRALCAAAIFSRAAALTLCRLGLGFIEPL